MNYLKEDIKASIAVFFVALPLCLGIALASGAPLFSGLIAGVVGGIVVGAASGSSVGVSGPAAGLTVLVLYAIHELGSFEALLFAVILAGIFQIIFGLLKTGKLGNYFPTSVIKGMLTGIGLVIILKQIPHLVGYNSTPNEGLSFLQLNGNNALSELINMLNYISFGVILISCSSLIIIIFWSHLPTKSSFLQNIPSSLIAVLCGVFLSLAMQNSSFFNLKPEQFVSILNLDSWDTLSSLWRVPDFSQWSNPKVYFTALSLSLIASLETLLCVEATDKLDPQKNVTPPNRELVAQGVGNIVSGALGGLPVTQVVIRSSANIQAGARSKLSSILHGLFLMVCVLFLSQFINLIPLASLASILLVVGYKLASPQVFKNIYRKGWGEFLAFLITVLGIIFTDILVGLGLGLGFSLLHIIWNHFHNPYDFHVNEKTGVKTVHITLAEHVSFLHKPNLLKKLDEIPRDTHVIIDASESKSIHPDILDLLKNLKENEKNMRLELKLSN